jgi:hypothetical protein
MRYAGRRVCEGFRRLAGWVLGIETSPLVGAEIDRWKAAVDEVAVRAGVLAAEERVTAERWIADRVAIVSILDLG